MANCRVWIVWLMLTGLVQGVWAEDVAYAVYSEGTLTFSYGVKPDGAYSMNVNTNNPDWLTYAASITSVVFEASFSDARPTSCYRWFRNFSNLENIEGIENLNTSQVTTMLGMFQGCSKLSSVDLSYFDTSKVTSMFYMFYNCSALASLDVSGFETQKVRDMQYMFYGCSVLTSLNLSRFNTSAVTNMDRMFARCSLLKNIYASTLWNTDKVTVSDNMFYGCSTLVGEDGTSYNSTSVDKTKAHYRSGGYLTELNYTYATYDASTATLTFRYDGLYRSSSVVQWDASNTGTDNPGWLTYAASITTVAFDASFAYASPTSCYRWFRNFSNLESVNGIENLNTSRVTTMATMFSGCSKLTSLDLSHFETSKVTSMYYMLANNSALTYVDLSSFDTSRVMTMGYMFYHCEALTHLDLSRFNTSAVTNMERMFANCNQLKAICVDAWWNTDKVTNSEAMFSNCHSLVGEDGTTVVGVSKTNAHGGAGGYMTLKTAEVTAKALDGDYWTTYYKSSINRMADDNTTVYAVRLMGNSIALEEIGDRIIEAGHGVVLKSSNAIVTLTSTLSASSYNYSHNSLHGTDKALPNPAYGQVYVLNKKTSGLGFYKLSSSGTIGTNKAYLLTESAMERESFLFDEQGVTGITPVLTARSQCIYNLQGHQMARISRGMNIINGKKYLKK